MHTVATPLDLMNDLYLNLNVFIFTLAFLTFFIQHFLHLGYGSANGNIVV